MRKEKKKTIYAILLFVLISLSACSSNQRVGNQTETDGLAHITITITENNGEKEITKETVSFKEGVDLFSIMKEYFEIEDKNDLITAINTVEQNLLSGNYWFLEVDDKAAMQGAKEIKLKDGSQIGWDLHEAS